MSNRKRISFFIGEMAGGGAEKVISLLANYYASKGYDTDIVMLLGATVNESLYQLDKSINVVSLSKPGNGYFANSFHWLISIRKYLKHRNPHCIVSFVGRINALVLTSSIGLRIPTLVSERNDPMHDGRSKWMLSYCNFIYKRATKIVFQSHYEMSCFSKNLVYKSYVIPNPIKVKAITADGVDDFLISTAGRLSPQKNHRMLIDAVKIVSKKYPNIRCEIYGDGVLRDTLDEYIRSEGLSDVVKLMGSKNDVHNYIGKSKFFVMTSNFEGLSNALMEAMCLSKVCITTDYPGANELITNNVNGIVVPCNNPSRLAEALMALINNDAMSNQFAKEAQKDSSAFDYDIVINKWNNAIQSTISSK